MPDGPIDENLGIIIRIHKNGTQVYMYKSEPGIFRTQTGTLIGEKIAHEAGFNVEALRKKMVMKKAKEKAFKDIDEQFESSTEVVVIKEMGGYKAIRVGPQTLGRYILEDPTGTQMNEHWMGKKEALLTLAKMVPEEEEVEETEDPKEPEDKK